MEAWPEFTLSAWAPTKKRLHLCVQMLGKLRVALSPAQPNWLYTALYLTARGVTTGTMPWGVGTLQATLDVFDSQLVLECSDGHTQRIPLLPASRTVADIYADLLRALAALGVTATLSPIPQELADVTPLDADHRTGEYDPLAVQRWFRLNSTIDAIFESWRSHFFGRSGIQLWWGALDFALLLFNGKHVAPPADRGYLMRYDLDAELLNAGFYPGDDANAPYFYAYIFPQPAAAPALPIAPATAHWSDRIKEWVLPYDAVRTAADPAASVRAFLDSVYGLCESAAGWDRGALSYDAPKAARGR